MTHQVLARKWRPRDFESLVGQQHVVRALTHALETGRLHHAYLLTGTRGVGKTTIARILARALNCETGVTAKPCGKCRACTEIEGGRFVDYIELDAASNRGVDEMTQLLENAVYAPTAGRYKVYVIDEVHMLSTHAFNAMLKTLEEPPPHVVFVLATTDPHKVPVTVLSRCLQFNLRNMSPAAIAEHLAHVLGAEGIAFEAPALAQIGRSAGGSMRDALSLLDQAIAFSGGEVSAAAVREMLGAVDTSYIDRILDALLAGDGPALVALADEMSAGNAPFERVLGELAARLQRIALAQVGATAESDDPETLARHAQAIPPEDLQVYYQIAIHGARDLPLAPDPLTGFTMTLLRLLAFRPAGAAADEEGARSPARPAAASPARPLMRPEPAARAAVPAFRPSAPPAAAPRPAAPAADAPSAAAQGPVPAPGRAAAAQAAPAAAAGFDGDWPALAGRLRLGGFAAQFLQQSELLSRDGWHFTVRVPIKPLAEPMTVNRVREALSAHFGQPVRLTVEVGAVAGETAAAAASAKQAELNAQAQAAIEEDPFVRSLIDDFGGTIVPGSVRPVRNDETPGESR